MSHSRGIVPRSVRRHGFGVRRTDSILVIGMERRGRRHMRSFGGVGVRRVFARRRRDLHPVGAPRENEQAEYQ